MGHKKEADLLSDLEQLKTVVKMGDPFECPGYPEINYEVTYLGFIESTEEPCIIYKKRESGQTSWVRTLNEYLNKDILKTSKEKDQLLDELNNLRSKIDEGEKCYHYKHPDHFYSVVGIGFIEGNGEPCVIYQAEYGDKLVWARTEKDFFAKVKLDDGLEVDRFVKVS